MSNWPSDYGRVILDHTDSTNAEAARRVRDLSGPTWILAHRQSTARGRRGRPWSMPEGNFAATLVMRPTDPPETVALRSFVAALALFDAFVAVTGRTECFGLKWPNDVLLNGGKVAGILLESLGQGAGVSHLAIGIGINLAAAPTADEVEPRALRPVSLIDETGAQVTPEEFLDHLATAYAHWEQQFTTYGFGPVREAWLARATRLGEPIIARLPGEEITGTFETVDMSGALIVTTSRFRHAIPAADVFF